MQALVLLNDPQFTEASRLIAASMMNATDDLADRIELAFRMATSRKPDAEEIETLISLYEKEYTAFENNEQAAQALLSIGEYPIPKALNPTELAATTVLANAILNLTETIMKG